MYTVYILYNAKKNKKYTGYTKDLEKRLMRHNGLLPSKKTSYTSRHEGTWTVVYAETFETRNEAKQRETFLKSGVGRAYVKKNILTWDDALNKRVIA